jgi:ribosomal protein S18 acetylase RimI-like enzyme
MVPAVARRGPSDDGLQPLRLTRDWRQVLALIELAFGDALDVEARRALHSMRLPPLLAPLIALIDQLSLPGEGLMPGFVWREGGRVVGTASVRRIYPYGHGWLISNVAVHPDWQGRGIGRALMVNSLDYARDYGGAWAVLQVRERNAVARRLYESLGFRSIGKVTRLQKPKAGDIVAPSVARALQPARWNEGSALISLARTLTPYDVLWADNLNRELYKTGPLAHIVDRLSRRRRRWWIWDEPGVVPKTSAPWKTPKIGAAVGVEIDPRTPWHRLRLLIAPREPDGQLAPDLIVFGLRQLAHAALLPVEIEHPASDETTQSALAEAGFEQLYALVHMRRELQ